MALRIETRISAILTGLLCFAPALLAQQQFRYHAWHGHARPPHIKKAGNWGTLIITSSAVSFEETYQGKTPKHPHSWLWNYQDIEQLKIERQSLTVLTYKDDKWKLGADREYRFDLVSAETFEQAYIMLKGRLDERLVAAIPNAPLNRMWEIAVKHLLRLGGDEGVLQVGEAEIVYKSAIAEESRTWRYEDIENISSSGPFQLTITTFERARLHYGSLKDFNFQLKQHLDEARYNALWLRLNQSKGLRILSSYRDASSSARP